MTTQEFVKKEAKKISKDTTIHGTKLYADGLTKGLEIAKDALKYARENAINGNDGCWDFNPHDQILQSLTDNELLTIFLTEKYGK